MSDKIFGSVEILTRNSALTLERCLESVKDFAEILILDGNSTDETLDIAKRYGCRIVKQYETDEQNVAIKDYSEVRNKGLRLAAHDWFMYIDSDEYLSREAADEIRGIIESPNLKAHAWWQPRKYVLDGKVVECATTYPNRQIRLFHRKFVEGFIKPIHERIKVKQGVAVGELKGIEYVPVEPIAKLKGRWRRYTKMEEEMLAGASSVKLLRLSFRQAELFALYTWRYLKGLFFCRGVRMPLKYEFARHIFSLIFSWRLFMKSFLGPLFFTGFVTTYSFFGQLGYSVFNADQFFYFPSIFRSIFPGSLQTDFMAQFSPAAFSFYDELIISVMAIGGLDIFWAAFILTFISRFVFFYALYRIVRYLTGDNLFGLLSLFIFITGFVVYGTGMRSFADMLLARDMALAFSLLSLAFLFERRALYSALLLGIGIALNVSTAIPFIAIFYGALIYRGFLATRDFTNLLASALLPALSALALWVASVGEVAGGIMAYLDPLWREIVLRRVPNIFVTTWYYPNSSPLYLAVSVYFYFLVQRELRDIFSDRVKRTFLTAIFWIPVFLTSFSVLGGEIFGSAFILQLQLSRSLVLWKLIFNVLFVFYAYRYLRVNPRDYLYNFSLIGIIASFIVSEKLMFLFLPLQVVLWVWKGQYARITSLAALVAALPILWYVADLHGTKNFISYAPEVMVVSAAIAAALWHFGARPYERLLFPAAILIMFAVISMRVPSFSIYPQNIFGNKEFMQVCDWIGKNTDQRDLFVAEPLSGAGGDLRLVCLRGVFVTKKDGGAGMFNRDFAIEWRRRLDLVNLAKENPAALVAIAEEYGARYVFADKDIELSYPKVFENEKYIIYKTSL